MPLAFAAPHRTAASIAAAVAASARSFPTKVFISSAPKSRCLRSHKHPPLNNNTPTPRPFTTTATATAPIATLQCLPPCWRRRSSRPPPRRPTRPKARRCAATRSAPTSTVRAGALRAGLLLGARLLVGKGEARAQKMQQPCPPPFASTLNLFTFAPTHHISSTTTSWPITLPTQHIHTKP